MKLLSIISALSLMLGLMIISPPAQADSITGKVPVFSTIKLDEDRTVVIKGPIRSAMADEIVADVYELGQLSNRPIYYIINTNGGSLMAGNQIIRAMESSGTTSICIVDRAAYSMGALILAHCNVAYIHKNASVMFHEGYMRLEGRTSEVFTYADFERKECDKLNVEIAKLLRMPLDTYIAKQKDEWWLTSEDTVRTGLTKGIILKLQYPVPEQKQNFFSIFGGFDEYEMWNTEDGVFDLTYYPQTRNPYRQWLRK